MSELSDLPEFKKLTPKAQILLWKIERGVTAGHLSVEIAKLQVDLVITGQKVNAQRTEADLDRVEKFMFDWIQRNDPWRRYAMMSPVKPRIFYDGSGRIND